MAERRRFRSRYALPLGRECGLVQGESKGNGRSITYTLSEISELDLVVLLVDLPERGLTRGQVGRVIQEMGAGVFEVEFSDQEGLPFAFLPLSGHQVTKLLFDAPGDLEYED